MEMAVDMRGRIIIGISLVFLFIALTSIVSAELNYTTANSVFWDFNYSYNSEAVYLNGSDLLFGNYFNGSIDEVSIWNRSLSAEEVYRLYSMGLNNDSSINLTGCGDLTYADTTYYLNNNVTSTGTCFNVLANNVTLDCNGYEVNYSSGGGSNEYGIYNNGYNNTKIRNCNIVEAVNSGGTYPNYNHNLYFLYAYYTMVENNSFRTRTHNHPIRFSYGGNNTVYNNVINALVNGEAGVYIFQGNGHNVTNNTITLTSNCGGCGMGVYLNDVDWSNVYNNHIQSSQSSGYGGIRFYNSNNNNISGNRVTNVGSGLVVYTSSSNSYFDNQINSSASQSYVIYGTIAAHYNQSIDTSNLAEGLPVLYNYSVSNQVMFENVDLSNVYGQVICAWCNNVTYNNVTMGGDGINLFYTSNSSVLNSRINTSVGYGIYLYQNSNNNNISGNNVTTSGSIFAIVGSSTALNNQVINIIDRNVIIGGGSGISLSNVDAHVTNNIINTTGSAIIQTTTNSNSPLTNILVENNSIRTGNGRGISLGNSITSNLFSVNNNFINFSGTDSAGFGILLNAMYNSNFNNNTIYGNATWGTFCGGSGVYTASAANNLTFSNLKIVTSGGVSFCKAYEDSNITIIDSILDRSSGVFGFGIGTASKGGVYNLTNVTKEDGSLINIGFDSGANGTLNMHWYLDANVTSDGFGVGDANVSVWNKNGLSYGSNLTGADGRLGAARRFTVLEYSQNSSGVTYFTPYAMNVSKTSFDVYSNDSVNTTNNILMQVDLLRDSSVPLVSFLSPSSNIGEETWANITLGVSDNNDFYSFVDDGSLVGWWRMDDYNSTHVFDRTGRNNGTRVGNVTPTVNGKWGKAMSFDGSSGYVDMGNKTEFNFTSQNFSVSLWVKPLILDATERRLVSRGTYNSNGWEVFISANSRVYGRTFQSGINQQTYSSIGSLTHSTWNFVTVNRNGSSIRIFVNGIDRTDSAATHINPDSSSNSLYINRMSGLSSFNGSIDNVMIFNRSLSTAEIQALYNSSYQYYRNKTNISEGDFVLTGYAEDSAGNLASLGMTVTRNYLTSLDAWDLEKDEEGKSGWFSSEQETLPNEQTYFFANYTRDSASGSSVTGAECKIGFRGGGEVQFGVNNTRGNWALGRSYVKSASPSGSYPDVGNESTDGVLSGIYTDGKSYGYSMGVGELVLVNVTVNLSNIYYIDSVGIWGAGNYSYEPDNVSVYTSLDGIVYDYKGISNSIVYQEFSNVTFSPVSARFVRFEFKKKNTGSNWMFIDELEVYGNATTGNLYDMSYNSSYGGGLYYFNRSFDYAGNYSWDVECDKEAYQALSSSGEIRVRVPLYNQSSLGVLNEKQTVNWNENVILNVTIPTEDIDDVNVGYGVSRVWGRVEKSDGTKSNVSFVNLLENNSAYASGLVGLWHMNNDSRYGENNTRVYDFSGSGNNGTVVGATWTSAGKVGGAYNFDGGGNRITNDNLVSNLTDFSVGVWFYPRRLDVGYNQIVTSRNFYISGNAPAVSGWGFWTWYQGNTLRFSVNKNNTGGYSVTTPSYALDLNKWYFAVATFSKSTGNASLYIDGILTGSNANANVDSFSDMGIRLSYHDITRSWDGSIDEVAIWNRSLSAEEILNLYQSSDKYQGTFVNPGVVGDYNVTYFANLTNGFNIVRDVTSNFSVQNTTIVISTATLNVNTTDTISVEGRMRMTNGSDFWDIANNNFIMKLNNVTVSSDIYNGNLSFANGTTVNVNKTGNLSLVLFGEGSARVFGDDYSDDPSDGANDFNVVSTNSVGYYDNDVIFSWNTMTESVGNITYNFSTPTKFVWANVTIETGASETGGGANTSMWYGFDGVSWKLLNSTTQQNRVISGGVNISGNTSFYVMLRSDTNGLSYETPVTNFNVSYSSFDYASSGMYTSPVLHFPGVAYTVLRWDEELNQGSVKVQLRTSSDNVSWGEWSSNFTNYLNNDISSWTGNYYLQFRTHLINGNSTLTPVVRNVRLYYFNATTNSTGGYSYNITIPTDSLGVLPFEVRIVENSATGIVGTNYTNLTVRARTNASYLVFKNYSGTSANYSVLANFTRTDTGDNVNGTINVTIYNATGRWSFQCVGGGSCLGGWLVPDNLRHGNYSVNVSVYNESGYYINSTNYYDDYLEEKNTGGVLDVFDRDVHDYNPFAQYVLFVNATISNTGNATMRDISVYDVVGSRGSAIYSVAEQVPCGVIWPGESCNALMRVVLTSGASPGKHRISWKTTWSNNDETTSVGGVDIINISYVDIKLNALMDISNYSVNRTIQHDSSDLFSFDVQSVGTDSITNVAIDFVEGNITEGSESLPSSWVGIEPGYIAGLMGGQTSEVDVNISIPAQTNPGNYSGRINVTSSAGSKEMDLIVEVPINGSYYIIPGTNLSYNMSQSLNTAGEIGNFTVYNIGNIDLNFSIGYSPSRSVLYTYYGNDLFQVNDVVTNPGMVANPSSVFVSKGGNSTISLWHKALDSPVTDVGVDLVFSNLSANPNSIAIQEAFSIEEQPPVVTNVWFLLDGVSGNIAERGKNLTIKVRATDDYRLNVSGAIVNVSIGAFNYLLNLTDLCSVFGQCDQGINPKIANFSVNFTPEYSGQHFAVATVYDQSGFSGVSSIHNFTAYGTTTMSVTPNVSVLNVTSVSATNSFSGFINFSINNSGFVSGYSPTLNFTKSAYINISNQSLSAIAPGVSGINSQLNVSRLTPPGNYTVDVSLRWRNPDNSFSSSSGSFIVRVYSNKSFRIMEESLSFIVGSGLTDSRALTINNTGNDVLSLMNAVCYSGDICSNFDFSSNESSFSVLAGQLKMINITLGAGQNVDGGSYEGVFRVSDGNVSRDIGVFANVPQSYTWEASPLSFDAVKGVSHSGEIGEVVITNNGNMDIDFDIVSTNFSILQPNVSSLLVPKFSSNVFMIEYTAPSYEGNFAENITISNAFAEPSSRSIAVNLTTTEIELEFIQPTTAVPLMNVLAGEPIAIRVNATYGDEILVDKSSWQIYVGDTNCSSVNYSYNDEGTFWDIVGIAPNMTDGSYYALKVVIVHDDYGEFF
jgi:hypothetical protein